MFKNLVNSSLLRNTLVISALTIPTILLQAQNALASKSNFRVYNDSNTPLHYLYISDSNVSQWGNDVLGQDVLPGGSNVQIVFDDPSPNRCLYDIRGVFADGQVVEDYQINVCANTEYIFFDR